MFRLIGNAIGAITEHNLLFQDWMLEAAIFFYSEWACKVMILEMAPEKWQMGFKMQHNDHYKMGLYFDLELLCTFYWDGSKDPREWGFSSQPEPHLVFGYEAFMNLKSHISRMVQKSPSLKHVTAAACSSWWSSGCHVAKSQKSKFKLMLD